MALIAGVDEAGRGSFLGNVYAGCVIWDNSIDHKLLKDSKKLSKVQREEMRDFIIEHSIAWSYGYSDNKYIDKYGIVDATMNAMHCAIRNLNIEVDELYIDGNYYKPFDNTLFTCFVQGDSLHKCISAASIIAKTFHDDHINKLPQSLHLYDIQNNMGYGTKKHIEALRMNGSSNYHRKSFIKKYC